MKNKIKNIFNAILKSEKNGDIYEKTVDFIDGNTTEGDCFEFGVFEGNSFY